MAGFAGTVSGAGRIIEFVSALAARRETCNAAIALGWLLAKSPNVVAIPGCRSRTQVHDTASGSELILSEAELAELEEALANS
jgi:aryl-alcohol dehydrogenase-like predicted oxidoreductase